MRLTYVLVLLAIVQLNASSIYNETDNGDHSVLLSRRKRFLVFPEGSSVQLVFCLTFINISPIQDIMLWGYTAALAYELPQDPYSPFDHHADPLHRRIDSKAIYYTNENGKVIYKRPYQRKSIVNPAFAKRSLDALSSRRFEIGTEQKFKMDRKQMHASKNKRDFLKGEHMEGRNVDFHRSSRGALYQKIETMLRGLGGNGRQCLMKTLCLVGQARDLPQGTFFQELLRAIFTLPQSSDNNDFYKEYDEAIDTKTSCHEAYPECENSANMEPGVPTFNY